MDVCETKNMDLSNKIHIFEPMKVHIYEPNIRLIRLFSLMLNYAKPRMLHIKTIPSIYGNGKQMKECENTS